MKKRAIVCGAGGFIGSHLMKRLWEEEYEVIGVDLKRPEYWKADLIYAKRFEHCDLTESESLVSILRDYDYEIDEIYQLAADTGGSGYIFSGDHDLDVMTNSAQININICKSLSCQSKYLDLQKLQVFFSSSACIYPAENQVAADRPITAENTAYPANPDSAYGWEKIFSERLYGALTRNHGITTKIARFHNVFGPRGSYNNGKEKAPAAMCRKIAELPPEGGVIKIWGDGRQTRSFLYIDEALEGVRRLMNSDFCGPVNIGSDEMISINELIGLLATIAGKDVVINHISGPTGVRGRNSDNRLITEKLGWAPSKPLIFGLTETYKWIKEMVHGKETEQNRISTTDSEEGRPSKR